MSTIEERIAERQYTSPATARAGVKRSALKAREKKRLIRLIGEWENEAEPAPVVGGSAPTTDSANGSSTTRKRANRKQTNGTSDLERNLSPLARRDPLAFPLHVNLNVPIRAHLTPYGISLLYAARDKVVMPEKLLESGGVWKTSLADFMIVMGSNLNTSVSGDVPTVQFAIDLLALEV